MEIFLLILKILGFTILGVIGLLLLILLCVLFVPVFYRMEGGYEEEKPSLLIRISWMFPFACIKGGLDENNKPWYCVRVFGIPIRSSQKKGRKKEKSAKEKSQNTDSNADSKILVVAEQNTPNESSTIAIRQNAPDENALDENAPDEHIPVMAENDARNENMPVIREMENQAQTEEKATSTEEPKGGFFKKVIQKAKRVIEKIKNIVQSLQSKLKGFSFKMEAIGKKIEKLANKVERIFDFLGSPKNQTGMEACFRALKKMLAHVRPRRITGWVHFGFEDPSTTGKVYGVTTIWYSLYQDSLSIEPDFENQIIEGNIKLKGRIMAGRLGIILLSLWRDQAFRRLLSETRKLKEEL